VAKAKRAPKRMRKATKKAAKKTSSGIRKILRKLEDFVSGGTNSGGAHFRKR